MSALDRLARLAAPFGAAAHVRAATRVGLQLLDDGFAAARVRTGAAGKPAVEAVAARRASGEGGRRELLRRAQREDLLRAAAVNVVLCAGQYELHQIAAPAVPRDELREAVRWQLRGVLSYPPEQATVDFAELPRAPGDGATPRSTSLLVAAARSDLLAALADELGALGIEPDAIDIPEFAQRNLGALADDAEGTQAWLAFDADSCLLTVQLGDQLCFARRIPLAGARAPAALDEAALTHLIERLALHVHRSLELFERQSGLPAVLGITLGPHRHAELIAAEILVRTGIDCQVFDPGAALAIEDRLLRSELGLQQDGLAALGAALRARGAHAGLAGWRRWLRWPQAA